MRCAATVGWLTCLLFLVGSSAVGAELFGGGAEPAEGLLILRNGQILSGRITNLGEYYSVVLPEGELRLRRSEVEFACRDLAEAYQRKRTLIARDNTLEHLQLAQWCVRHGLLEAAAAELEEARRLEPDHPLIAAVQRRLETALEPAPPASQHPSAEAEVTVEQLERMMRELPPGSVETFTRLVQPLLMNSCAAGGCHGPQAEKFPLLRVPSGKPVTRRITQRNIYQALRYVDVRKPEASPLLTIPLQPHGGLTAPIFTDRNAAQHDRLVQWVMEVSGRSQSHAPATVLRHPLAGISAVQANEPGYFFPDPPNSPNKPNSSADSARSGNPTHLLSPIAGGVPQTAQAAERHTLHSGQRAVDADATQPAVDPQSELPSANPSHMQHAPENKPHRMQGALSPPDKPSGPVKGPGKLVQPLIPADPFDPEIFNRRYFGR